MIFTETFDLWAQRWNLPPAALQELIALHVPQLTTPGGVAQSEADVQNRIRAEAGKRGAHMWRNNSGSYQDETGRWVRYGLGNDSKRLNEIFKSPDLVGVTPVTVRPDMVGRKIGVFTAIECKDPAWKAPKNKHEGAQMIFLALIKHCGGIATFANDPADYERAIHEAAL